MVQYKDRRGMRQELAASGYKMEYLDEWQPKTTLYRHAPGMTVNGAVAFPVGSEVKNVPGNPDYVIRKAKIGMLPYPPNDACACKWCQERAVKEEPEDILGTTTCGIEECSGISTSETEHGRKNGRKLHRQAKHEV